MSKFKLSGRSLRTEGCLGANFERLWGLFGHPGVAFIIWRVVETNLTILSAVLEKLGITDVF